MSILYKPQPVQKEFLEAVFSFKYKYLCMGGSVAGGKTYACLGAALMLMVAYPGSKVVVIRDSFPNLKESSIETWEKLINYEIGPHSFITSQNITDHIYYCANNSSIRFIAEDFTGKRDMSHLYGVEFSFAVLDEIGTLQLQTFHRIVERTGRWIIPGGAITPSPVIMCSMNPVAAGHWARTLFYDPFVAGTLSQDYYFLNSRIEDNKFVFENKAYMESTKRNTPAYLYRRRFENDWNIEEPSENRIYRCFNPDVHIAELKYDPSLPLQLSFDENVNPYMSLLVIQIVIERNAQGKTIRKNIHIIDEILGRNPLNTCEGICTLFKKKYHAHTAGILIYGDATSNKQDSKVEKGMNFYRLIQGYLSKYMPKNCVPKSNPSVILRTSFADAIFENESADIRFRIDTNCRETINDFILTRTDSDGTKLKENVRDNINKVSYQPHGHLSDCFDYFLCYAFNSEYSTWQSGGRSISNVSWGRNPATKNHYDYKPPSGYRLPPRISKNDYI